MNKQQPVEEYVAAQSCPNCGSSNLNISPLSHATCLSCAWQGTHDQLLAFSATVMTQQQHDMFEQAMSKDIRGMLAKVLSPVLLQFLVRWGFLDKSEVETKQFREDFLVYLNNMGRAVVASIINTRSELDRQLVQRQRGGPRVGG